MMPVLLRSFSISRKANHSFCNNDLVLPPPPLHLSPFASLKSAKSMESLKKLDCFICNKDIEEFYNLSSRMIQLNRKLMEKIVRQTFGIKALSAGRVVVLNSSVSSFFSFLLDFFLLGKKPRKQERNQEPNDMYSRYLIMYLILVPQKHSGGYSQDCCGSRYDGKAGQILLVLYPDRGLLLSQGR